MNTHEQYMQRCLDLALLGAGTTSPNPMVGAVIVHDGRILGEGYTSPYGGPHAEVNAIQQVCARYGEQEARKLIAGSTMYVSLEPCAHFGKTPPCADLIVSFAPQKVVVGCLDLFAKVNGQGIAKLQAAGIAVEVGVLEAACRELNRRFFTPIEKFRPYVILKWAQTNDGYFAPANQAQKWISNAASKQLVHKWRSEEDAILVGAATALIDDPALNTRLWKGKSPKRVLVDKELVVSPDAKIYAQDGQDVIVFNALKTDWQGNLKFIALENFDLYLPQNILYQLYLMDVKSILIEGGAKTIQQFLDAGLWDEARVFVGNTSWGEGKVAPTISIGATDHMSVGDDKLYTYRNR